MSDATEDFNATAEARLRENLDARNSAYAIAWGDLNNAMNELDDFLIRTQLGLSPGDHVEYRKTFGSKKGQWVKGKLVRVRVYVRTPGHIKFECVVNPLKKDGTPLKVEKRVGPYDEIRKAENP